MEEKLIMLKAITVTDNPSAAQQLINSLNKHGWDYVLINSPWRGFGTKLIETYNFLKSNPEITEFIFCDAFDVVAMGTPDEFKSKLEHPEKLILSAERGLWPPSLQPFKNYYPQRVHGFNYPNSGLYYCPSILFINLMEGNMPFYEIDDQFWMNMQFLLGNVLEDIVLDHDQVLFNSHSFISDGEYGYEKRIQINGNQPLFIHSNARTIDEKLNQLLL